MNNCQLLDEVRKLQHDIHVILSRSEPSSQLMDEPLERLMDAMKKFKEMDDKEPNKKQVEHQLSDIGDEITAHEEKEAILEKFPELANLPKLKRRRL